MRHAKLSQGHASVDSHTPEPTGQNRKPIPLNCALPRPLWPPLAVLLLLR